MRSPIDDRPRQLGLLEVAPDPSAPRNERLGWVEDHHFARPWRPSPPETPGESGRDRVLVGIDEAGRGPLAGPVSVAAVCLSPASCAEAFGGRLEGLDDSKRMSATRRQALFSEILALADRWAIVHVQPGQIDVVNILGATHQGMALAVEAALAINVSPDGPQPAWSGMPALRRVEGGATSAADWYPGATPVTGADVLARGGRFEAGTIRLLVDGHRPFQVRGSRASDLVQIPVVKGDGLSVHIAAASVLAKVSRDAVMTRYHQRWPRYGFDRHKGYPTRVHLDALKAVGPCTVHRRSFRPVLDVLAAECYTKV